MRWLLLISILMALAGCGSGSEPESAKMVAAFEIPLASKADRTEFLSVVRTAAASQGMHVDAATDDELEREARVIPIARRTLSAAVWRGSNDQESVAAALDGFDHPGRVWLLFSKGEDPGMTTQFRERVLHDILLHWPQTLPLPITPSGGIPLAADLIRTPTGYRIKPSEAHKYDRKAKDPGPR